ncbi:MAG: NUDIX hydrolase [Desulfobacter sp.]|nr:MAG: NUDIX hydrolase [Desulfobacter sp.]
MKICSSRNITDHSHLNLVSVDYLDRNGTGKKWIYASRGKESRPDAVVVVPFHKAEDKLVLIREFRVPLGGYQYGFPAGLVDAGEGVDTAGRRELYEETGLKVTKVLRQSPPIFSSSGMTDESICLLYVECDGRPDTHHNEASEEIDVVMLSPQEAKALLQQQDYLFDVKSWIVLDRFAATGCVL